MIVRDVNLKMDSRSLSDILRLLDQERDAVKEQLQYWVYQARQMELDGIRDAEHNWANLVDESVQYYAGKATRLAETQRALESAWAAGKTDFGNV